MHNVKKEVAAAKKQANDLATSNEELLKAKTRQTQDHKTERLALDVKHKETSERLATELKKQKLLHEQLVAGVRARKALDQQVAAALKKHTELKEQVTSEGKAKMALQEQVSTMEKRCKSLEDQVAAEAKKSNELEQQIDASLVDSSSKDNFFQQQSAEYEAVITELKDVLEQSQVRINELLTSVADMERYKVQYEESEQVQASLHESLRRSALQVSCVLCLRVGRWMLRCSEGDR
jgi:Ni,Fe-hydrogenase III large subunit